MMVLKQPCCNVQRNPRCYSSWSTLKSGRGYESLSGKAEDIEGSNDSWSHRNSGNRCGRVLNLTENGLCSTAQGCLRADKASLLFSRSTRKVFSNFPLLTDSNSVHRCSWPAMLHWTECFIYDTSGACIFDGSGRPGSRKEWNYCIGLVEVQTKIQCAN